MPRTGDVKCAMAPRHLISLIAVATVGAAIALAYLPGRTDSRPVDWQPEDAVSTTAVEVAGVDVDAPVRDPDPKRDPEASKPRSGPPMPTNDAAAEARRHYDLRIGCYRYVKAAAELQEGKFERLLTDPTPQTLYDMEEHQQDLAKASAALVIAAEWRATCEHQTVTGADEQMYEQALAAGEAGDAHAAICYASGGFSPPDDFEFSAAFLEEYRVKAPQLIEQQFLAGNWRAIYLYGAMYNPPSRYPGMPSNFRLMDEIRTPNPLLSYRFQRLRSLISDPAWRARLEESFALQEKDEVEALPPHEAAAAKLWAEQMKQKYFADVNDVESNRGQPPLCEI